MGGGGGDSTIWGTLSSLNNPLKVWSKKTTKNTIWDPFWPCQELYANSLMYFLIMSWNNGGTAKFQPVKAHTSSGISRYYCHLPNPPTHHLTCHLYYTPKFPTLFSFIATSVNTFFNFFTFSELKISKVGNVNTFEGISNWFSLPKPNFFAICLNFQQQNPLTNQYLPHLSSENCEMNSIKSDSLRAFQQFTKNTSQFQYIVSVLIWF